jgi:hypothetical protein
MPEIRLNTGAIAIVDEKDFARLSQFHWREHKGRYTSYAVRSVSNRCGLKVDHRNGNGLDNRRSNLRHVTNIQNLQNQRASRKGSSRFKGVHWVPENKCWMARICVNKQQMRLGRFKNEEEAARAYDRAAREHFGEFARPNFI